MNEVEKCPKCGGELEIGLVSSPRGIGWLGQGCTEELLSEWHLKMPKLLAWRCEKCQLVIFLYGNEGVIKL